jgi:hypothetical protein
VAELTTDAGHHWATATAAPCTSVFKPVSVTEPVDLGPAPTDRYDRDTLWWRHERLHRAGIRDPERLLPTLVGDRDDLERSWTNHRPGTAEAFAAANDLEQAWTQRTAGSHGADRRPWLVRRYWRTRDLRAGLTG